ncbi:hypothetical protein BU25DRAFT_411459 [Macroventuria anomochaeta]|uniref:Uncharacterized protein n=1 Tax=Macroventuria anomochaeta TaxID=301207 RepID=A0ACB6RZV4_9PLEO|nr:uncharacterized protein BU25DRAFT_411459 [Macroventuria anomochaeta]KAF2626935.1 hypothetical protein BU25DRAFT_411459 [Macroventuria anomochaeta]
MGPLQRPSPDRQIMLYSSSHLQGMERPVRSFKSLIRATSPRTSPEKPLPPVPPPLQKNPSSSSITTIQTRSTELSLWEVPSNWAMTTASKLHQRLLSLFDIILP